MPIIGKGQTTKRCSRNIQSRLCYYVPLDLQYHGHASLPFSKIALFSFVGGLLKVTRSFTSTRFSAFASVPITYIYPQDR